MIYNCGSGSSNNNNNNNNNNNRFGHYSTLPNHLAEERQDVIFRKVRGILNKITPETFDKLSKEVVNVGLDSPRTIGGVIYLLFDKALKDLKYSSLYAKLCQELSEKAPNFEQEPGPNTFCKFLISKCEDEFERRRKATEDFDSKNELTDEEHEQKAIAKQKMLGNIKFICELGKKRLLQKEILHECIRGLLSKKKERPIQDQAQDLECLCQIMRTIGSLLDVQASRNLMNQYFERIDMFSKKPELPSRIRFMLRDVIDLRNNNWRPRPFQREDNVPQPLSKLREETGLTTTIDKLGNNRNLNINISNLSKLHRNKLSSLLLDDDEPSFTTSTDFHWGPAFLPQAYSGQATFPSDRNYRPSVSRSHQNLDSNNEFNQAPTWRKEANSVASVKEQPLNNAPGALNPVLPKHPSRISDANNFSLRPSHNLGGRLNFGLNQPTGQKSSPIQLKSDSTPIDPANQRTDNVDDKVNSKSMNNRPRDGGAIQQISPTHKLNESEEGVERKSNNLAKNEKRDLNVENFCAVLSEHSNDLGSSMNQVVAKIKELKIPKMYHVDCLVSAMKRSIVRSESDRQNTSKLFVHLVPSIFENASLLRAFKIIFKQFHELEVETPKVKSLVAGLLSQSVVDGLLGLEEIGNVLSGGKHHPLFLLFLQKLEKHAGQAWLSEKFMASKINLMEMLPEVDRTKDRLASALKDRCLGFLDPMLTVEPDLWAQMKEKDASPAAVYRWIKDNVDQSIQGTTTFAHVLIACLLRYIHGVASEKTKTANSISENQKTNDDDTDGSNKSSPTSSSLSASDVEKELLSKYQQVLQAILKDKQMQLATLYALQSFFHGLDFPKGSLLRWFHMLYDMNIVDDDVFFIWKEEINDEFPGKGQALFQVNTWLNWLAEAESEEEDDEDDDEEENV